MKKIADLQRNRTLYEHVDKFFVVTPNAELSGTPFYCPVCESCMKTDEDESSYEQHGCCLACETEFVRPNPQRWRDGWRPTEVLDRPVDLTVTVSDS